MIMNPPSGRAGQITTTAAGADRIGRLLPLLVTILILAGCQQDIDKGLQAFESGNYPTALAKLQPLADQGEARAQFALGAMYAEGWGVDKDVFQAVKWIQRAAEQGHEAAQFKMGLAYANGHGVRRNDTEALRWYLRAADQG